MTLIPTDRFFLRVLGPLSLALGALGLILSAIPFPIQGLGLFGLLLAHRQNQRQTSKTLLIDLEEDGLFKKTEARQTKLMRSRGTGRIVGSTLCLNTRGEDLLLFAHQCPSQQYFRRVCRIQHLRIDRFPHPPLKLRRCRPLIRYNSDL